METSEQTDSALHDADSASQFMVNLAMGQNWILEMIATGSPLEETMAALLRYLERERPEMLCSVQLLDPDGIHLHHCAAPSLPEEYCKALDGAPIGPRAGSCGTAAYRAERVIVADIETDPLWEDYRELARPHGLRACWSTPILDANGRVLGTFAMYFQRQRTPDPLHQRIIEIALHVAAIAIGKDAREKESLRLTKKLEERVKEMGVLRQVSQLLIDRPIGRELFDDIVRIIPSGWLEPDLCRARITYDKWETSSEGFIDAPYKISKKFSTSKGEGLIEVAYVGDISHVAADHTVGGVFLPEEHQLLSSLAESLTIYLNRAHVEEALRTSEERYRLLNLATSDVVWDWDVQSQSLCWNDGLQSLFGYPREEFSDQLSWWSERVHPGDRQRVHESLQKAADSMSNSWSEEYRFLRKDGTYADILDRGYVMRDADGAAIRMIGIMQDITSRKRAEEAVRDLAYLEPLTRLPSRAALLLRAAEAIEEAARSSHGLALVLVNLNGFRDINDSLGHQNGDLLLRRVAERLRDSMGAEGTVASLGGDEFAILLPRLADRSDVEATLREIHEALKHPVQLANLPIKTDATLGVAFYPSHGESVDLLWQHADVALRTAKERYEPHVVYSSEIDHYDPTRLILLGELHSAIEDNQLLLHYQPKIDISSGRTIGAEALVRWKHPSRGLIFPDAFIPLAERTGLINPLTTCVVISALQQGVAFLRDGFLLDMSVNLSARNLHEPGFSKGLLALAGDIGFPLSRLTLEVTETAIMADPVRGRTVLTELHQAGIHLSMDDFGIGQSSLSYIKELPITKIKIDKSFVMDFEQPRNVAVVRSVIDLARNMGLQVTAEGVEDEATYHALRSLGCDLAQGYFFSKPLPTDQLTRWLRESPWGFATA